MIIRKDIVGFIRRACQAACWVYSWEEPWCGLGLSASLFQHRPPSIAFDRFLLEVTP